MKYTNHNRVTNLYNHYMREILHNKEVTEEFIKHNGQTLPELKGVNFFIGTMTPVLVFIKGNWYKFYFEFDKYYRMVNYKLRKIELLHIKEFIKIDYTEGRYIKWMGLRQNKNYKPV